MPDPKDIVLAWVDAFNRADVDALARLYAEDAVNHQVVAEPLCGRAAIRGMFQREFLEAEMVCIVENLFQDGEWAMLEWRDPKGLRGCGFFRIQDGLIRFQRGYWDRLSFLQQQGLPLPRGSGAVKQFNVKAALRSLESEGEDSYRVLFEHGTLEIGIYGPRGVDPQQPHSRDEVYVVISGTGSFVSGGDRRPFEAGEVLFVPAGAEHRFEDFGEDFATWVFFYGPEGGELA